MAKNKNKKNLDPKPAKVDENSEVKTEEAGAEDNDKLKELESRLLTSLAENENLRKRFDREKEDLSNYVISNFAKEILSVLDNLQRAIASVKVKEVKEKSDSLSQSFSVSSATSETILTPNNFDISLALTLPIPLRDTSPRISDLQPYLTLLRISPIASMRVS